MAQEVALQESKEKAEPTWHTREAFAKGDEIIRVMLEELAAAHGLGHPRVELDQSRPGVFVYRVCGTDKSVALREREIRYAADDDTRTQFVTPRLKAMFENVWWGQALVLLGLRNQQP